MITIAELFPLYSTGYKWLTVFRPVSTLEAVRLEKEYVVHSIKKISKWNLQIWTIDDSIHNTNDPARISYYDNGNIDWQEWWNHGRLHRTDGPASIGYYENGNIHWQSWYIDGNRHRTDGPARITYYENCAISFEQWYIDGKKIAS